MEFRNRAAKERSKDAHILCGILLLALLAVSTEAQGQHSNCQALDPSPPLTMFKDALPIPPTIDVSNGAQLILGTYKITQVSTRQVAIHSSLVESLNIHHLLATTTH